MHMHIIPVMQRGPGEDPKRMHRLSDAPERDSEQVMNEADQLRVMF